MRLIRVLPLALAIPLSPARAQNEAALGRDGQRTTAKFVAGVLVEYTISPE